MKWTPTPTFAYDPRLADKVRQALDRKDARALRLLGVPWFDWRTRAWRKDHEEWMRSSAWRFAPEYGGRAFIRRAKPVPSHPRLCIRVKRHGKTEGSRR